ncbi:hypothetical protein [Amycolatopsis anabasis]|nr:hypothetical protein [Amycolatopsis anabasis]
MAERGQLVHSGLIVETARQPDGTIVVRLDPGDERFRLIVYEKGTLPR